MTLTEYRKAKGITLVRCALELGMSATSKGRLSRLENGREKFPIGLALLIQTWSGGEVRAVELLSEEDAEILTSALEHEPPTPPATQAA